MNSFAVALSQLVVWRYICSFCLLLNLHIIACQTHTSLMFFKSWKRSYENPSMRMVLTIKANGTQIDVHKLFETEGILGKMWIHREVLKCVGTKEILRVRKILTTWLLVLRFTIIPLSECSCLGPLRKHSHLFWFNVACVPTWILRGEMLI